MHDLVFFDFDGVLNSQQSAILYHQDRERQKAGKETRFYLKEESVNGRRALWDRGQFCPIATAMARELLEDLPNVKVVISSSWRLGESLEELRAMVRMLDLCDPERVIGSTPYMANTPRGYEIKAYLDGLAAEAGSFLTGGVRKYAIIDDDSDMLDEQLPNFFQTSYLVGLTWPIIDKIRMHFKSEPT